jgi:choice-of-anchor A domain-containing protein
MNKRFSIPMLPLRDCFVFLGLMVLAVSPASAIFIGSVDLGSAGPDSYVLLTINTGTKLTANNESAITGNVGILGGAAKYSTSGDAFIDGTAFLAGPTSIDPSRAANIVTNADAQLQQARNEALNAAAFAAGLAPTITSGPPITGSPPTINSGFGHITITGGAGTNVINLYDLTLSNNDVLTLDAPAGSAFIINISHDFKISGSSNGGRIELSGGLTPFDVLYNVLGTGSDVAFTGGSTDHIPNAQVYGTVLAPDRSVKFTPGIVFGEIIGGGQELTLTSGADAFGFSQVPEASAFAPLLGVLSLASIFQMSRRNRRRSE